MKIIVVGVDGFIGGHIASYFSKTNDHQVFAISWSPASVAHIKELCDKEAIDVVINATGSADVVKSVKFPVVDFEANVSFHFSVMDAIKNKHCKYIYFSSAAVYGNPQKLPITETDTIDPVSPYGWHKYYGEQMCREFASLYEIQTASLRLFSVYGPGQKKMLFYDLYNKCNTAGDTIELQGSGNESRDFICVTDVPIAVEKVISMATMQGECYNVASGIEMSIRDVATQFVKIAAPGKAIHFSGQSIPGYPSNWKADISRISGMGFMAKTNFDEGLKETIQWLKENV